MKVPGILATRAHASGTANTLLDAETAEENGGAESGAVAEASSSRTVGNCSADQRDSNDIQLVDVGGVAGGAKAVHKALGLFLKTPDDSHGIYGSMVMAAKVMKLEVNANRYIHGMDSIHVSAPLSTIVDVPCKNCGGDYVQRVQVQALLPVGPETLRVGSSDGGVTMHQDPPGLRRRCRIRTPPFRFAPLFQWLVSISRDHLTGFILSNFQNQMYGTI